MEMEMALLVERLQAWASRHGLTVCSCMYIYIWQSHKLQTGSGLKDCCTGSSYEMHLSAFDVLCQEGV